MVSQRPYTLLQTAPACECICSASLQYMGLGKTNDCLWKRDNTQDLDVPSDDFHSDMPVETCFCMNESGTARAWAFAALPLAG